MPAIEPCPPRRLPELLAFVAEGFPSLRGVPADVRFPPAFRPEPNGRLVALGARGAIEGSTVVRPCRFGDVPGAMLGMVLVAPEARGRGLGGELVRAAERWAVEHGARFAVLWTGRHGFYGRLGWELADPRGTGAVAGTGDGGGRSQGLDAARCAAVRGPGPLDRDWASVPPGARAVESHHDADGRAYALVGRGEDVAHLYELVGEEDAFPEVWASASAAHARILIDEVPGSRAARWLERHAGVALAPAPQAMWRALGPDAPVGDHVPWFDRV